MNEELKEKISNLTDESELKEISLWADARRQQLKDEKAMANKTELEAKYKGKYLIKYGREMMAMAVKFNSENHDDITIIHVLDIEFKGRGFFRCHAKVIHIQYDPETSMIGHLTSNGFNEVKIQCFEDSQYDINESDISQIVDQNTANGIINEAKKYQVEIMNNWDL
jgi:hypothetical protein